jgi:hypothetical protein
MKTLINKLITTTVLGLSFSLSGCGEKDYQSTSSAEIFSGNNSYDSNSSLIIEGFPKGQGWASEGGNSSNLSFSTILEYEGKSILCIADDVNRKECSQAIALIDSVIREKSKTIKFYGTFDESKRMFNIDYLETDSYKIKLK